LENFSAKTPNNLIKQLRFKDKISIIWKCPCSSVGRARAF